MASTVAFCSFADTRMARALVRVHRQATLSGFYDAVWAFDESDLPVAFRQRHADVLVPGVRGFGYYGWKPVALLQAMNRLRDGDILNYADAGCWINHAGSAVFCEYLDLVRGSRSGMLGFACPPPGSDLAIDWFALPEYAWTKADVFERFGVARETSITHTEQLASGILFLRKCPKVIEFLHRWADAFENDRSLFDDTPSRTRNHPGFIAHRHDQSVFSVLAKLEGTSTRSYFECFRPDPRYPSLRVTRCDWNTMHEFPIWARRDRGFPLHRRFVHACIRHVRRLQFEVGRLVG